MYQLKSLGQLEYGHEPWPTEGKRVTRSCQRTEMSRAW